MLRYSQLLKDTPAVADWDHTLLVDTLATLEVAYTGLRAAEEAFVAEEVGLDQVALWSIRIFEIGQDRLGKDGLVNAAGEHIKRMSNIGKTQFKRDSSLDRLRDLDKSFRVLEASLRQHQAEALLAEAAHS